AALVWGVYETYVERSPARMGWSFVLAIALLGIPFYGHGTASVVIGLLVIGALLVYLNPTTQQRMKAHLRVSARTLNTTLLCTLLIVMGYSSYTLIMIRSAANTPMDQNSPEDIFTLGEYLNREQYGTRPLFYGQAYSSRVALDVEGGYCVPRTAEEATKYVRKDKATPDEKDSYVGIPARTEYVYAQNMLFPRMYDSRFANDYKSWVHITGYDVPYDECGTPTVVNMPTQWENLKFFFTYQVNWMYWRYFMWNFVGRQNDLQGDGGIERGNWITGFNFIDKHLVGDQTLLPTELKENKGHNVFYCLPLLLGIIGLLWQAYRGPRGIRQFWVVFFLFFMTGLAIVLYLNQTPNQPRERDYAYAASFYAFAIWTGLGVAGIVHLLRRYAKPGALPAAVLSTAACLLVPLQMAGQTWDDHDRSHRYFTRDFGQNYLMSLPESGNPIIYTNGDNDTFPLWYNQETEGFRTDARTCNLSYLQTDWYIDQMKRPAYDSPSLPITWEHTEYMEGTNDMVEVKPALKQQIDAIYAEAEKQALNGNTETRANIYKEWGENPYELKNILKHWVRSGNSELHVIPTDSIVIKVDKDAVRRSGMMLPGDTIPDYMHISLKGKRMLYKNELMMLEMLAEANWERPIYMAVSVGSENYLGMENHFVQEGLAYRITPFDTGKTGVKVDSETMYDNLMNKFTYGGLGRADLYIDENAMKMVHSHRRLFATLITQLMREGKREKAQAALDYAELVIPEVNLPYDMQNGATQLAEAYYQLGETEKADHIMKAIMDKCVEYITWYLSLDDARFAMVLGEVAQYYIPLMNTGLQLMKNYQSPQAALYQSKMDQLYELVVERANQQ
ncbi:MAG: hypothetical protein LBL78_00940, partial [Prevotellaceae bacterium]|nr:hypothetical protein [Prevotellaceae bacterium]